MKKANVRIYKVNENKATVENEEFKVEINVTDAGIEYSVYPKIVPAGSVIPVAPRLRHGVETRVYDSEHIDDMIDLIHHKLSKIDDTDQYNPFVKHYVWNGHIIYTVLNNGNGHYIITCSGNCKGIAYAVNAYVEIEDTLHLTVEHEYTVSSSESYDSTAKYEVSEV